MSFSFFFISLVAVFVAILAYAHLCMYLNATKQPLDFLFPPLFLFLGGGRSEGGGQSAPLSFGFDRAVAAFDLVRASGCHAMWSSVS